MAGERTEAEQDHRYSCANNDKRGQRHRVDEMRDPRGEIRGSKEERGFVPGHPRCKDQGRAIAEVEPLRDPLTFLKSPGVDPRPKPPRGEPHADENRIIAGEHHFADSADPRSDVDADKLDPGDEEGAEDGAQLDDQPSGVSVGAQDEGRRDADETRDRFRDVEVAKRIERDIAAMAVADQVDPGIGKLGLDQSQKLSKLVRGREASAMRIGAGPFEPDDPAFRERRPKRLGEAGFVAGPRRPSSEGPGG